METPLPSGNSQDITHLPHPPISILGHSQNFTHLPHPRISSGSRRGRAHSFHPHPPAWSCCSGGAGEGLGMGFEQDLEFEWDSGFLWGLGGEEALCIPDRSSLPWNPSPRNIPVGFPGGEAGASLGSAGHSGTSWLSPACLCHLSCPVPPLLSSPHIPEIPAGFPQNSIPGPQFLVLRGSMRSRRTFQRFPDTNCQEFQSPAQFPDMDLPQREPGIPDPTFPWNFTEFQSPL